MIAGFLSRILFISILFSSVFSYSQQKINFGRYNSRAIYTPANTCPAPLVVMVPGSGPNGPEEMMPSSVTGSGKDESIFQAFTTGLHAGNVSTLAIGKPGVDFFKSWNPTDIFYDLPLYKNLKWQDLIENLHDAITYAKQLSCTDGTKITILGHSEGTQVAVDYATQNTNSVSNLILIGFVGENTASTIKWQVFERPIDTWITTDVDQNHDGFISVEEAKSWPEFTWPWTPNQKNVSIEEIKTTLQNDPIYINQVNKLSSASVYTDVLNRAPIYSAAATLPQNIFVFTGQLDVQTRPEEALRLKEECTHQNKINCEVMLVPGLGHAMSPPKGPRKQKLLDATLGPVDNSFIEILTEIALKLK